MSKTQLTVVCSAVLVFTLLLQSNICSAAEWFVGDNAGWGYHVAGWEDGKSFKAGDILVFNYPLGSHTVVQVNKANYDSCTPSGTTFASGLDFITLKPGFNYFISGISPDCSNLGMKIAVNAA
ncbi:OLC1v1002487C1 [Oldenlandia corymbosa var. corymbosa]|uniref:OLC1v1002487C1 n=1 Tax=Oldenlandia corymbosa var. corymbosa TaxID=529605 RepID=A0AAV1DA77_OLDCO|nr:OLC1v1002487C1 [Oldenlandia corymbosa var. corymbosa]